MNKKRILLIDDEAPLLRMLRAHLEMAHFHVTEAANANEALNLIRTEEFSLVLCDYVMPEMDGKAFLDIVKHEYPHLPVIIMTGYPSEEKLRGCLKAGAEDYLTKPFNVETLEDVIHRALQKAERLHFLFGNKKNSPEPDTQTPPPPNPLDGNW